MTADDSEDIGGIGEGRKSTIEPPRVQLPKSIGTAPPDQDGSSGEGLDSRLTSRHPADEPGEPTTANAARDLSDKPPTPRRGHFRRLFVGTFVMLIVLPLMVSLAAERIAHLIFGDDGREAEVEDPLNDCSGIADPLAVAESDVTTVVRADSEDCFLGLISAVNPSDEVQVAIRYSNRTQQNRTDVVVGARLPEKVTLVPRSLEWNSGHTGSSWTRSSTDSIAEGGVTIGSYAPGGAAYLRFRVAMPFTHQLQCGRNPLNVGATVITNAGETFSDEATIVVYKECQS